MQIAEEKRQTESDSGGRWEAPKRVQQIADDEARKRTVGAGTMVVPGLLCFDLTNVLN
jgi:hypothetical protein